MGSKSHKRTRDVPHHASTGRAHAFTGTGKPHLNRVRKEDGTSFQGRGQAAGAAPARPPFCMLFDDLVECEVPTGVFGMYPTALIAKLMPWLRCQRREVLHVCSGGLPRGEGIRIDLRIEARPDIIADGRALPLADASVAAVLLDPPYSEHYARETFGLSMGFGYPMRAVTFYEREQESLFREAK